METENQRIDVNLSAGVYALIPGSVLGIKKISFAELLTAVSKSERLMFFSQKRKFFSYKYCFMAKGSSVIWPALICDKDHFPGLHTEYIYWLEGTVLWRRQAFVHLANEWAYGLYLSSLNKVIEIPRGTLDYLWKEAMTDIICPKPEMVDLGGQNLRLTKERFEVNQPIVDKPGELPVLCLDSEFNAEIQQYTEDGKVFISTYPKLVTEQSAATSSSRRE